MEKQHIEDLFPGYLEGTLSKEERESVDRYLADNPEGTEELKAYQQLLDAMAKEPLQQPSARLTTGFLTMLEEEKSREVKVVSIHNGTQKPNTVFFGILKYAAGIALLITAFLSGRYFKGQEVQETLVQVTHESQQLRQTAMISLMENQSPSKRIQGVQYIEEVAMPDETVVAALAERMLYDENTNVRLTAVEALSKFATSKKVSQAFVTALTQEKDPSVQIAIIQNLVKIQEKKAVAPMKKLLEEEETQPFVKEEINQVLSKII